MISLAEKKVIWEKKNQNTKNKFQPNSQITNQPNFPKYLFSKLTKLLISQVYQIRYYVYISIYFYIFRFVNVEADPRLLVINQTTN